MGISVCCNAAEFLRHLDPEKCLPWKEAVTRNNVDNYLRHLVPRGTLEKISALLALCEACRYVMSTVDRDSSEFSK